MAGYDTLIALEQARQARESAFPQELASALGTGYNKALTKKEEQEKEDIKTAIDIYKERVGQKWMTPIPGADLSRYSPRVKRAVEIMQQIDNTFFKREPEPPMTPYQTAVLSLKSQQLEKPGAGKAGAQPDEFTRNMNLFKLYTQQLTGTFIDPETNKAVKQIMDIPAIAQYEKKNTDETAQGKARAWKKIWKKRLITEKNMEALIGNNPERQQIFNSLETSPAGMQEEQTDLRQLAKMDLAANGIPEEFHSERDIQEAIRQRKEMMQLGGQ